MSHIDNLENYDIYLLYLWRNIMPKTPVEECYEEGQKAGSRGEPGLIPAYWDKDHSDAWCKGFDNGRENRPKK